MHPCPPPPSHHPLALSPSPLHSSLSLSFVLFVSCPRLLSHSPSPFSHLLPTFLISLLLHSPSFQKDSKNMKGITFVGWAADMVVHGCELQPVTKKYSVISLIGFFGGRREDGFHFVHSWTPPEIRLKHLVGVVRSLNHFLDRTAIGVCIDYFDGSEVKLVKEWMDKFKVRSTPRVQAGHWVTHAGQEGLSSGPHGGGSRVCTRGLGTEPVVVAHSKLSGVKSCRGWCALLWGGGAGKY